MGKQTKIQMLNQQVRANATDLRDITVEKASRLVEVLDDADLVFAVYPSGDEQMLKGEDSLRKTANGKPRRVETFAVRVANGAQAEMVCAAIELTAQRAMGSRQIETLVRMLLSVQNGTDA